MTIKKVLVANRGEIAVRIIRSCKEMGVETIAVHSKADTESLHVMIADYKVCIGPAPSNQSYLKKENLLEVAKFYNADAIHPGYGFLAEDAEFAKQCEENNIIFIGPRANHISLMGDKIAARETAAKVGVPIIESVENTLYIEESEINDEDFPLLIKAASGGGGKGMRVVDSPNDLKSSVQEAKQEADAAFGDSSIYIERFIENARHVEVQVIADSHGNVIHLGERDCSIQRRHQKLIEETPCVFISNKLRHKLYEDAIKLTSETDYLNAGTIEFLVDVDKEVHYFIEMNTRIQVEHPVTEMVTGVDIVKEQMRVASGDELSVSQDEIKIEGHSIESRVNAEDPENNFMPSPGVINQYIVPSGLGIRVETFCYGGYKIVPFYDSMVGKVIVKGETRDEAINKLKMTLKTFYLNGLKTTIPLHLSILENEEFKKGAFNTKWLEKSNILSSNKSVQN